MEPSLWIQTLQKIEDARQSGIKAVSFRPPTIMEQAEYEVVSISGILLKRVPEAYADLGIEMTGYAELAEEIKEAAASTKAGIMLQVNSGGGMVDGIDLALDAIKEAKASKPVVAYVDGLCASAAFWLTSQADKIYATRFSEVGSIGVYSYIMDTSKLYDRIGLKTVVSRSGDQKGAGIPGDPVTDRMKAAQDEIVMRLFDKFLSEVVEARPGADAANIGSGRVWLAEQAQSLGLIDGVVKSVRDIPAPASLFIVEDDNKEPMAKVEEPEPQQTEKETKMSDENTNVAADERARVKAILEAFPGDSAFAMKHIDAGSTLVEAKAEYCDVLKERAAARDAIDKTIPKPIPSGEAPAAKSKGYMEMAYGMAAEKNISVSDAAAIVAKTHPDAYYDFIGVPDDRRAR